MENLLSGAVLLYSNPWSSKGSVVKNLPANAGDTGSISVMERCPGGENGNPLQCSYLENPMDRGAWWATVHGVSKKLDMTLRLNITWSS